NSGVYGGGPATWRQLLGEPLPMRDHWPWKAGYFPKSTTSAADGSANKIAASAPVQRADLQSMAVLLQVRPRSRMNIANIRASVGWAKARSAHSTSTTLAVQRRATQSRSADAWAPREDAPLPTPTTVAIFTRTFASRSGIVLQNSDGNIAEAPSSSG